MISDLVEDLDIYPRGRVNDMNVANLIHALDAGAVLPAPVIDRSTMKIIDGFHRVRAWRKRLGDDAQIEVDIREYADDAERLLASARLNAGHGLPLGRYDQRVVALKAERLGIREDEIAAALAVTPARLLRIKVLQAQGDNGPVPLKYGAAHMSGRYITPEQAEQIRSMRSGTIQQKALELSRLLRSGLTPESDGEVHKVLAALAADITAVLE